MQNEEKPLHIQVYDMVVESQEAKKHRENNPPPATPDGHDSLPAVFAMIGGFIAAFQPTEGILELFLVPLIGVLIGGAVGWLVRRAFGFVFVTLLGRLVNALRRK